MLNESFVRESQEKIEKLRKVSIIISYIADLSNINNFIYLNDLSMPHITRKKILQIDNFLCTNKTIGSN